jgi:AraC-like DNA-binding protein
MDPQVSQALAVIHADPARPWTVAALAQHTNLSRSAFALRFAERTGQTPAAYIAALRLALAADKLKLSLDPVVTIADEVGYGSNAAFTRAFTRRYGVSPNRFRAARS